MLSNRGWFVHCLCLSFCVFLILGIYEEYGKWEKSESEQQVLPKLTAIKRTMLVGISESTEQVCESTIFKDNIPHYGHLLNGSYVEILQTSDYRFVKTYVKCSKDDRPSCVGIQSRYISECVTVYESAPAMVRLLHNYGPFQMNFIRVPIFCECRLRRQYRHFEKIEGSSADDDDDGY